MSCGRSFGLTDHNFRVLDHYLSALSELNSGKLWEAMEVTDDFSPWKSTKEIISNYLDTLGFNSKVIERFHFYWADSMENAEYCLELAIASLVQGY